MRSLSKHKPAAVRHVPQRSCVACRQVKDKREMVRLVRSREGVIEIDITGKKDGRGAYLCTEWACWEKALKGKQLEHTLKASLGEEKRKQLSESGQRLLKEMNRAQGQQTG